MKLSKQIILYLAVTQAILIFMHAVLFAAALFFFPVLSSFYTALLITLFFLAISFNVSWAFDIKKHNEFFRWLYIISSTWMSVWPYLLMAFAATSTIYLVAPQIPMSATAAIFTSLAIILNIYGIINARVIRIKKLNIKLPNLPDYWKNKTAVLASDLHLGHILREGSAKKIVDKINSLKPDIVFIPGDFFDGIHTEFSQLAKNFKYIKAPLGTYFCSGNHELYAGIIECERALKNAGITILENQKIEIQGLQIAGLAYTNGQTNNTVSKLLVNLDLDKNKPSILLKHVPDRLAIIEQTGISFVLCGHTHQGQVWPIRYLTSKIFKGFDYGLKKYKHLLVYISSGVGTWGPPVRIFTKSEIVRITFK